MGWGREWVAGRERAGAWDNIAEGRLGWRYKGIPDQDPLPTDEEPFLIFANRYYLRRLNLDGSNYTLLKQVPKPFSRLSTARAQYRLPVLPTRAHGCLLCPSLQPRPPSDAHVSRQQLTSLSPFQIQGLNNAVALDFDYREQMIYWTDVTTQGSMIRRMHLNGSNVQVKEGCPWSADLHPGGPTDEPHSPPHTAHVPINTASAPLLSHTNTLPVLGSPSLNTECKHRDPSCLTPLHCAILWALGVCRCSRSPC